MFTQTAGVPSPADPPDAMRRGVLAVAASVGFLPLRVEALSPVFMLIGPSIAAGILALLGIKMQRDFERQRHADDLAMSRAKLRLELERLAHDKHTAAREERLFVFRTLLENDEEFRTTVVPQMRMSFAIQPGNRQLLTTGLMENVDGTRLGLTNGQIAIARGHDSGVIDNELALQLGDDGQGGQVPLPVPIGQMVRDLNERTTRTHQEQFARQMGADVQQVRENWALAGEQRLSSARRPTGNPDIVAVAFMPKNRGTLRYSVQRA